ncbi:MAG: glycoside hydrolase family 27 protein [Clostridia bacterium]|nr:glycoside hydrolase family 27 protein [Clostridia bacterium]
MIKHTPPMGWNSWNTFGEDIHEQLILETADCMVSSGLKDLGYEYLVIDDCWSLKERDRDGRLVADPKKFPRGMKALAEDVHAKGLKFGMYSCAGNLTCAGYPGSYEHEFADAATFAEWGVDFLKYDYCYHSNIIHGKYLYRRMGLALKNCGREILFSACSWGIDGTPEWIRETGANMWRSTGDIFDTWESVKSLTEQQQKMLPYGGVGCFNDMDMLVVGMYGRGNVGLTGLNDTQYKTHFSIWALFGSPLMIGCDVRNMTEATKTILSNRELIAINQDPECASCYKAAVYGNPDAFVLVKPLSGGDYALGFFNFSDVRACMTLNFWDLGLSAASGRGLRFHDCLSNRDEGVFREQFSVDVPSHGCGIYRCGVVSV